MSNLGILEIKQTIARTNNALLNMGYNLKDLDAFWNDCIKAVRKEKIMNLFFEGKSTNEIVDCTGFSKSTVQKITSEYWDERMDKAGR